MPARVLFTDVSSWVAVRFDDTVTGNVRKISENRGKIASRSKNIRTIRFSEDDSPSLGERVSRLLGILNPASSGS
ncbi:hypothetical protein QLX08_003892 [Tetragonisca angustula]|uniref:Uncharacterized protein n=1 Tax=Tetragonisca angustula TaxID=166442 RepID=A0AAW1A6T0_9HYME